MIKPTFGALMRCTWGADVKRNWGPPPPKTKFGALVHGALWFWGEVHDQHPDIL